MRPINRKILEIIQNVIRIALTLGVFLWISAPFWQNGYDISLPLWGTIALGAVIGGLLFAPANKIGILMWDVITILVRQAVKAPEIDEEPNSERSLRYAEWQRAARKVSLWQLVRKFLKPSAKVALIISLATGAVVAVGLIVVVLTQEGSTPVWFTIATIFAWIGISFLVLLLLICAISVIGIKLYFHQ